MNTTFLLMAQYDGKAIIPLKEVCRDYFTHLSPTKFIEKVRCGEIRLPLVYLDSKSQKSARGVALVDLAKYLDKKIEAARHDMEILAEVA